ncbi:MAG: AraC family transcriptional regulator [Verrucomicrobiota bacterium]
MRLADQFPVHPGWRLLLRDLSIDAARVLRRAGLPEDLFVRENAVVTTDEYFELWRGLEAEAANPLLGIRIGQAVSVEMFDPPLFAALCSQNLGAALARIAQYKRLVCPMKLNVKPSAQGTRLEIVFTRANTIPPTSLATAELVFYVQLARLATRAKIQPLKVTSPHPPELAREYADFFGIPVQRGPALSLAFSTEDARRPFLTANESMWKVFEPELRKRLSELEASATMTDRIRGALLEQLPAGDASISAVAQRLGMSGRTLQRRLTDEGRNFQGVVSQIREELARHYLRNTKMTGSEISFLLGYADPNSFFRAFQTWTGQNPKQVRVALRETEVGRN